MNQEAYLVDKTHKAKRVRNIKIACVFIYTLIFAFVLSLGHSLSAEHEIFMAQKQIEKLSADIIELSIENEYLQKVVR